MRIALVQDWMTGFAGGEQVLLALHEMYPDAPIFTSLYRPEKMPQFAKATVISSYLQKIPGLAKRHQLAIPLMPAAFESFDLKGYDLVISVGGGFSKGVITHPGQRHLSYCHTPIRYAWRLGGDTRNENRWDSRLRAREEHKLRLWDVVSAERVDQFVANSQTVQKRIEKIYRKSAKVVYPPVAVDTFAVAEKPTGEYYLSVGRLVHYKRVDLVVRACIENQQHLKIVGTGPEEERLKQLAASAPWIEFCGRVSDQERDALYQNARAFVFAAEEDFGIVPVEAMACGRPVISYNRGGVTESVVANVSGEFFAEQTVASLAAVLKEFRPEKYDPAVIRKRAEKFSLDAFQKNIRREIEFRS